MEDQIKKALGILNEILKEIREVKGGQEEIKKLVNATTDHLGEKVEEGFEDMESAFDELGDFKDDIEKFGFESTFKLVKHRELD